MSTARTDSLPLRDGIVLDVGDVSWSAVRAQGAGGQNVNKVASAVHLRFDIDASSLPASYKERLKSSRDRRISEDGVIVIKAQRFRTREKNLDDALQRLQRLVIAATETQPERKPTRPSAAARRARMDGKTRRSKLKRMRGKPSVHDE